MIQVLADRRPEAITRFVSDWWWDVTHGTVSNTAHDIRIPVRKGDPLIAGGDSEYTLQILQQSDERAFGNAGSTADMYLFNTREYLQRFSDAGAFEDESVPLPAREEAASSNAFANPFLVRQTQSRPSSTWASVLQGGVQNLRLELTTGSHNIPPSILLLSPSSVRQPSGDRVVVVDSPTSRRWMLHFDSGAAPVLLGEGLNVEVAWAALQPTPDANTSPVMRVLTSDELSVSVPIVNNVAARLLTLSDNLADLTAQELAVFREPAERSARRTKAEVEQLRQILANVKNVDASLRFHDHDATVRTEIGQAIPTLAQDSRLERFNGQRTVIAAEIRALFESEWLPAQLDAAGDAGNETLAWLLTLLRTFPEGRRALEALDGPWVDSFVASRLQGNSAEFRAAISMDTVRKLVTLQRYDVSTLSFDIFDNLLGVALDGITAAQGDSPLRAIPARRIVLRSQRGDQVVVAEVAPSVVRRGPEACKLVLSSVKIVWAAGKLLYSLSEDESNDPSGRDIASRWQYAAELLSGSVEFYEALELSGSFTARLASNTDSLISVTAPMSRAVAVEAGMSASAVVGTFLSIIASGIEVCQLLLLARDLESAGLGTAAAFTRVAASGVYLGMLGAGSVSVPPLAGILLAASAVALLVGFIGTWVTDDDETADQERRRSEYEEFLRNLRQCDFGIDRRNGPFFDNVPRQIAGIYSFFFPVRGSFWRAEDCLCIATHHWPREGGRIWFGAYDADEHLIYSLAFHTDDARTGYRLDAHPQVATDEQHILVLDASPDHRMRLADIATVRIVMSLGNYRLPVSIDPRLQRAMDDDFDNEAFTTRATMTPSDPFSTGRFRQLREG